MADTFARANARYERNFRKYGTGTAPRRRGETRSGGRVANYAGATNKRSGGSIARGTSTYSRGSQFRIAQAAAAGRNRNRRVYNLTLNKRTGIYEASSEGRR